MSDANTSTHWTGRGWTADVVDNEDGGGWALAMTPDGYDEPVLVVPWVMGRNKKDPKPLNQADFNTQVKAAQDFLTRREQQLRTAHRVSHDVVGEQGEWVRVIFDIIPDEIEPEGQLVGLSREGEEVARVSCPPSFKLTRDAARQWVTNGMGPVFEEHSAW
ncbi:MAG: hypothetical protein AAFS10_12255 [Myxococcota bacterium]